MKFKAFLKNFFEIFLRMERTREVKLACPRCGSLKVYPSSWLNGWLTPPQYVCEKCGYKGPILMKIEDKD
ncbi:hypothetical protein DRO26_00840 [Candidatus Bathyarchaeota archaeon]|nr:MAG: hypothetical protein DRO26_00840 [Candidatus Bathyarchaeota archaeon]